MNKSILMSIQPKWVAKILNGEKTIEVRKKFPKDYVGWVYIYCTKAKETLAKYHYKDGWKYDTALNYDYAKSEGFAKERLNGKVVARFWCDKVEEIFLEEDGYTLPYQDVCDKRKLVTVTLSNYELCTESCLNNEELVNYLKTNNGYAIHISKLEVFEKPKELKEFGYRGCNFEKCYRCEHYNNGNVECGTIWNTIIKAPQSWCYIEV